MSTRVFEQHESEVRLYCRVFPKIFQRAKGSQIFDTEGRGYLDFFAGAGALNYGHNPEPIKEKLLEYLGADGIVHGLDVYTTQKALFLQTFVDTVLAPRGLDYKIQFPGPTGANAVEAALKLARKITGRTGIFAFTGSFHGMTMGSSSVTASLGVRAAVGVPLSNTTFIPFPDGPHGAFDSLGLMKRLLEDSCSGVERPAAVILESVQMDGGVYPSTPEFLQGLRALCDRFEILMICDDIQVGCGRTGDFFSFDRAGIQPDIVTLSKSIGGYGLPMAVVLMKRELDRWSPGEHTGTFRANQLSLVAATAALEYWKDEVFLQGLREKSQLIQAYATSIGRAYPQLQVRSIGMVAGLDLAQCGGPAAATEIQRRCFEAGLILERCGREDNVLKVLPALTIPRAQLVAGLEILSSALAEVLGSQPQDISIAAMIRPAVAKPLQHANGH